MCDRNPVPALSAADVSCRALQSHQWNDFTIAQLKSGQLLGFAAMDMRSTFDESGPSNVKITFRSSILLQQIKLLLLMLVIRIWKDSVLELLL